MRIVATLSLSLLFSAAAFAQEAKVAFTIIPTAEHTSELRQVAQRFTKFLDPAATIDDSIIDPASFGRCATAGSPARCVQDALAWGTSRVTKSLAAKNLDAVYIVQTEFDQKNLGGTVYRIDRSGDIRAVPYSLIPLDAKHEAVTKYSLKPEEHYLLRGSVATRLGLAKEEQHVTVRDAGRDLEGTGIVK